RILKEADQTMGTCQLEMAEGGTCRDTERSRLSKRNSLPRNGKGRDLSGHGKKLTKREALTSWRWQREGLVRTRKENNEGRGTHKLEMAEGWTCHDTERNQPIEGSSPTGAAEGGACQYTERN